LIRAYIGQGLRHDLARLEGQFNVQKFIDSLRKHGVDKTTIDEAMSESG
jgi:predicted metal-dependent phosphotriesterase family hydrolase